LNAVRCDIAIGVGLAPHGDVVPDGQIAALARHDFLELSGVRYPHFDFTLRRAQRDRVAVNALDLAAGSASAAATVGPTPAPEKASARAPFTSISPAAPACSAAAIGEESGARIRRLLLRIDCAAVKRASRDGEDEDDATDKGQNFSAHRISFVYIMACEWMTCSACDLSWTASSSAAPAENAE
jgi:hypothetical protein